MARIESFDDARRLAKRRLPWMVFDYFDGAAGSGRGDAANQSALFDLKLEPRALRDVKTRDVSHNLFGATTGLPFGISPMGMCNLSGPGADLMLARLAAKHSIPTGVSTAASTSVEKISEASEGNAWFQLYYSDDAAMRDEMIDRAEACGCKTLVFTVDVPEVGRRPRELRRGFKMPFKIGPSQFIDFALHPRWSISTLINGAPVLANFDGSETKFNRTASRAGATWEYLKELRARWKGNLVVKGIINIDDALQAKAIGVDAVQVSNHGGRQLESAKPAITALAEIRAAVGPEFTLLFDSGIRSGEDIVKAYASGADFVLLGRPWLFAIAADGERGLNQFCSVLEEEVSIALALIGKTGIGDVDRGCLV